VRLSVRNKDMHLGTFARKEQAALVYDIAVVRLRGLVGSRHRLNYPTHPLVAEAMAALTRGSDDVAATLRVGDGDADGKRIANAVAQVRTYARDLVESLDWDDAEAGEGEDEASAGAPSGSTRGGGMGTRARAASPAPTAGAAGDASVGMVGVAGAGAGGGASTTERSKPRKSTPRKITAVRAAQSAATAAGAGTGDSYNDGGVASLVSRPAVPAPFGLPVATGGSAGAAMGASAMASGFGVGFGDAVLTAWMTGGLAASGGSGGGGH
jgi:hypothetical protein